MIGTLITLIALALGTLGVTYTGISCFIVGRHMMGEAICKGGYVDTKTAHAKYKVMEHHISDADKFINLDKLWDDMENIQVCSSNVDLKDSLRSGWNAIGNKAKIQANVAKTRVKNEAKKGAKRLVRGVVRETVNEMNPFKRSKGEI